MKKYFFSAIGSLVVLFMPVSTFAAVCLSSGTPRNFIDVLCLFIDLITTIIPIVGGIALLVFFWGLAKFIWKAGDSDAREEGRQVMFWGIIALFVMVSVWGIVSFVQTDLFGSSFIGVPSLPVGN